MPFLSHAGVSLRYDRAGAGPALLLVHGWMGNRTVWQRQVQALDDVATVITVDLRGHGESSRPRTGYTIGSMAADLEHLVRSLGLQRVAVGGWSMGGLVALELVRRLGERASALALIGTTPGGLSDAANPLASPEASTALVTMVRADPRAAARDVAARCFHAGAESPYFHWLVGEMQKTPPHVITACLDAVLAADARKHLTAITAPTQVLHGRHDALLSYAGGEYLAQHIKGATFVPFDESGHAPHLEEPDKLNDALRRLIA